jgi:hypothetical protein
LPTPTCKAAPRRTGNRKREEKQSIPKKHNNTHRTPQSSHSRNGLHPILFAHISHRLTNNPLLKKISRGFHIPNPLPPALASFVAPFIPALAVAPKALRFPGDELENDSLFGFAPGLRSVNRCTLGTIVLSPIVAAALLIALPSPAAVWYESRVAMLKILLLPNGSSSPSHPCPLNRPSSLEMLGMGVCTGLPNAFPLEPGIGVSIFGRLHTLGTCVACERGGEAGLGEARTVRTDERGVEADVSRPCGWRMTVVLYTEEDDDPGGAPLGRSGFKPMQPETSVPSHQAE